MPVAVICAPEEADWSKHCGLDTSTKSEACWGGFLSLMPRLARCANYKSDSTMVPYLDLSGRASVKQSVLWSWVCTGCWCHPPLSLWWQTPEGNQHNETLGYQHPNLYTVMVEIHSDLFFTWGNRLFTSIRRLMGVPLGDGQYLIQPTSTAQKPPDTPDWTNAFTRWAVLGICSGISKRTNMAAHSTTFCYISKTVHWNVFLKTF